MAEGTIRNKASTFVSQIGEDASVQRDIEKAVQYKLALQKKAEKELAEYRDKLTKNSDKQSAAQRQKNAEKYLKEEKKRAEKNAKDLDAYQKELAKARAKEELEEQKKNENALKRIREKNAKELGEKFGDSYAGKAAKVLSNAISSSIDKYVSVYSKYMSSINARLQGAGLGYDAINKTILKNAAASPYYKYTDVINNLNSLVQAGIADNVVQRAFLATISDKIATTFNAAESSLLEIIRIQQRDSTAARLGMEAELTQLFNNYFSDTSYLSNTFDSVQATLVGLSSQYGTEQSIELEYMIQKWLGSLGSVGVSSSTLQTIASGIGALGTGDVDTLSSNSALQNLLVMASNYAGLPYGEMLSGGVNAYDINSLLAGVVEYIQSIASTQNNVVKAQYAQLFGLSVADINAFKNISKNTIDELYKSGMTYSDTLNELNDQLSHVSGRMHLSEKIDNVLDNALAAIGINLANNAASYGIYKAADMLEKLTGGIELPFVTALGTGMDLNMSLEGLVKAGVIGFSTIGALTSALSSLSSGGGMSLANWELELDKGSGFQMYDAADRLVQSTSSTRVISSGGGTGMQKQLASIQEESGEKITGTKKADADVMIEILKYLKSYFEGGGSTSSPLRVMQVASDITPFGGMQQ